MAQGDGSLIYAFEYMFKADARTLDTLDLDRDTQNSWFPFIKLKTLGFPKFIFLSCVGWIGTAFWKVK